MKKGSHHTPEMRRYLWYRKNEDLVGKLMVMPEKQLDAFMRRVSKAKQEGLNVKMAIRETLAA